jgi:hypothetical protein
MNLYYTGYCVYEMHGWEVSSKMDLDKIGGEVCGHISEPLVFVKCWKCII